MVGKRPRRLRPLPQGDVARRRRPGVNLIRRIGCDGRVAHVHRAARLVFVRMGMLDVYAERQRQQHRQGAHGRAAPPRGRWNEALHWRARLGGARDAVKRLGARADSAVASQARSAEFARQTPNAPARARRHRWPNASSGCRRRLASSQARAGSHRLSRRCNGSEHVNQRSSTVLPFASRPTRTTLRGAPNWCAGPRCIEAARPAPMRPVRAGGAAPSPARKTALRPSASPKHRASQSRQSAVPPDADCWRECSNPAPKESREGTDASRPMGYLRCGLMGLMYRCSVTLGNIGAAIVGMVTR